MDEKAFAFLIEKVETPILAISKNTRRLCLLLCVGFASLLLPLDGFPGSEAAPDIPGQPTYTISSKFFTIHHYEGFAKHAKNLLTLAENARTQFHEIVTKPLNQHTDIYLYKSKKEFSHFARSNPEHILACAAPSVNQILINDKSFGALSNSEQTSIFVHEYAHYYLGRMVKDYIPRWLNEGIAMHCGGQWSLSYTARLSFAQLFGRTIPLGDLEISFPPNRDGLELAYAQSYSVVDFIMRAGFKYRGVGGLIDDLADPNRSENLLDIFQDPFFRNSIEYAWKHSHRRLRNIVLVFGTSTLFWFVISVLFLIAYYKKKRRQREILNEWEEDDLIYSSLDDE